MWDIFFNLMVNSNFQKCSFFRSIHLICAVFLNDLTTESISEKWVSFIAKSLLTSKVLTVCIRTCQLSGVGWLVVWSREYNNNTKSPSAKAIIRRMPLMNSWAQLFAELPRFYKMSISQVWVCHYKDKTVMRPILYLYNKNFYIGNRTFLYWNNGLDAVNWEIGLMH